MNTIRFLPSCLVPPHIPGVPPCLPRPIPISPEPIIVLPVEPYRKDAK